jgi:hypothetical protein
VPDEKIVEVARFVRARFRHAGIAADPDDVGQDAALAALVAIRRDRVTARGDRGRRAFTYLTRAGFAEATLASKQAFAAVHLTEYALRTGKTAGRVPLDGIVIVDTTTPEDALEAAERGRQRERARARWRRVLDRHLARLAPRQREAVEMMLGLRPGGAADAAEVRWRTGMRAASIEAAVRRFAESIAADEEARRLRRVTSGVE